MKDQNLAEEYIITALLELMSIKPYDKISITDIAKRAGVVRITYYRHFDTKEDILIKYFENSKKNFESFITFLPKNEDEHYELLFRAFSSFKENKELFKMLSKAKLEYLYLEFLNSNFENLYKALKTKVYDGYFIAGALYNVSMQWLKNDCQGSVKSITDSVFSNIPYFKEKI